MDQRFRHFVGIDWGTQTHCVVLLDGEGRAIEQYNVAHSGEGLFTLVERLKQRTGCKPVEVAVAVEVAWGALIETLVENGFSLFSINPKQVDRFRDRLTVAGAKDDSRDALVLATSLRTDRKSYKRVEVESPDIIRLRELSRFEEELKAELRRATNRLWQQLHRYYPQMLSLSPAADDRFIWKLLSKVPTPAQGANISRLDIERILATHRIRKFTADEVLAEDAALPSDASLILSIPGIGPAVASTLLTEASRPIRERNYQALRCYAGTAPITKQSGKKKTIIMRNACSGRLRKAVYHWASTSINCDSRSRQQYDALRASGHHHARALRGLADRLLGILVSMLKHQTTFSHLRRQSSFAP